MDQVFLQTEGVLIDNYYSLCLVNEYIKQRGRKRYRIYSITDTVDNLIKFNADYPMILVYNYEADSFSLFEEAEEPEVPLITMKEFSRRLHSINYFQDEEDTYFGIAQILPRLKPYIYGILDGRLGIKTNKENFKDVIKKLYTDMELSMDMEVFVEDYPIVVYNLHNNQFEYLDTFYGKIVDGDEFILGVNKVNGRENCW